MDRALGCRSSPPSSIKDGFGRRTVGDVQGGHLALCEQPGRTARCAALHPHDRRLFIIDGGRQFYHQAREVLALMNQAGEAVSSTAPEQ